MKRANTTKTEETPNNLVLLDDVLFAIDNVKERAQLEEDQALRNHRWEDARMCLATKDACERIRTEIRFQGEHSVVREIDHARRKNTAA